MNITDFVESIKLQLSDLEKVGSVGYIEGISDIITTNLKALDITQRPIHCTDKKREVLYVKDEDKWEKDEEKKMVRKAIKNVADKNSRLLLKFREVHPDCNKSNSKYSDQYNKIIVEAFGGQGNDVIDKEDKIIKNITKNVSIEKQ
jgi:transcriptional regulator with PAS, ATPase and Fis domain